MIDYKRVTFDAEMLGETNDCAIRALSIVTQTPYDEVWDLMDSMGRKPQGTAKWDWLWAALKELGYKYVPVNAPCVALDDWPKQAITPRQPNGSRYTMKTVTRALDPSKRYLVYSRAHMAAVINGQVEDWSATRKKIAQLVWEIVPA